MTASFLLPLALEDSRDEVRERTGALVARDGEFDDIGAVPEALVLALATNVRQPTDPSDDIERDWNQTIVDHLRSTNSIGVLACHLRYLESAVDSIVLVQVPDDQLVEATHRVGRAVFRGLEAAARTAASDLAALAYRSVTTGLRNKTGFKEDIQGAWSAGRPFSLLYIDMDGLKCINDTEGHEAGDAALASLGSALASKCGAEMTPYHFSGDEFGILALGSTVADLKAVVATVRAESENKFSVGYADKGDGQTHEEVVNLADNRMSLEKLRRKASGEAELREDETPEEICQKLAATVTDDKKG